MHASEDLYEFEDSGAFIVRFCLRRGRRRRKGGEKKVALFLEILLQWRQKKYPIVPSNVPIDNFMLVVSSTVKGNHNCL